MTDTPLTRTMTYDTAPQSVALDTFVQWARQSTTDYGLDRHTTQILSLVMEEHMANSFPFPLFISLHATDHPAATMLSAEATGIYVLATNPGNGFLAAYHTDLFHRGGGVSIGANIEIKRMNAPNGTVYGFVAHNDTDNSNEHGNAGFMVQGGAGAGWNDQFLANSDGAQTAFRAIYDAAFGQFQGRTGRVFTVAKPDGNVMDAIRVDTNGDQHLGPQGQLTLSEDGLLYAGTIRSNPGDILQTFTSSGQLLRSVYADPYGSHIWGTHNNIVTRGDGSVEINGPVTITGDVHIKGSLYVNGVKIA